jgi:hypothetical protein
MNCVDALFSGTFGAGGLAPAAVPPNFGIGRAPVFVSAIFEFSCLVLRAGLPLRPQKKMAPQAGPFS